MRIEQKIELLTHGGYAPFSQQMIHAFSSGAVCSARFVVILNALLLWGLVSQIPLKFMKGRLQIFRPCAALSKRRRVTPRP